MYQLTQIQLLHHIFRKWKQHLPNEFAQTYGTDCLGAFEMTQCDEVFKAYEEFCMEFFEIVEGPEYEDVFS